MNWKEFITTGLTHDEDTSFAFHEPAAFMELAYLKECFGLTELPAELEALYRQTNGIDQLSDGDKIADLIWPIERVIKTNTDYRTDPENKNIYMSFDQLLFVSDAGNGALFGYITLNGRFNHKDIYVWNPIEDSRSWIAPNLEKFIAGWIGGTITI
jgi:hypothetical protein